LRLAGAAATARRMSTRWEIAPGEAEAYERRLDRLRVALDGVEVTAAQSEGQRMSVVEAVRDAKALLERLPPPLPAPRGFTNGASGTSRGTLLGLTARQQEVAALVAQGLSNRAIAASLTITERTAENHVEHILTKLGFRSRAQIAAWATEQALTQRQGPN
jgi:DNA-binding NarL/FixJ family response regulator